jgi:hypothetical protein
MRIMRDDHASESPDIFEKVHRPGPPAAGVSAASEHEKMVSGR